MLTEYELIDTNGIGRTNSIDWPREPSYQQMKALIDPLIQSPGFSIAYFEHVRVWHEGEYRSMFVDDSGALKKLPVNEAATRIYHANLLAHEDPQADTSDWPRIHGPAVLFNRNVWA